MKSIQVRIIVIVGLFMSLFGCANTITLAEGLKNGDVVPVNSAHSLMTGSVAPELDFHDGDGLPGKHGDGSFDAIRVRL